MNYRKLIRNLFFSTNKCNRSLAFELAKSTGCHKATVEELYKGLLALPHFQLVVDQHLQSTTSEESSVRPSATEAAPPLTKADRQQACIEQFCDAYFHKKMNLNGYHLSSHTATNLKSLPPILLKCTFLEYLDLSHNDLEELPTGIGQLFNLRVLNLSSNPKIKRLPKSLAQLTQLEHLNLSGIFDLFSIELSGYRLRHDFPEVLRSLRQLRHLNLQDVMLDRLPDWIEELTQLESLHLFSGSEQHPLLHLPNSFTNLQQLKTLTIDAFTVHIPNDIHRLRSLEGLVVNHARSVPTTIRELRRLRYLDLSYLSLEFSLTTGESLASLSVGDQRSRLALFGWDWLLEMSQLEEFIYKHAAPYQFTPEDVALLQEALPNCTIAFE